MNAIVATQLLAISDGRGVNSGVHFLVDAIDPVAHEQLRKVGCLRWNPQKSPVAPIVVAFNALTFKTQPAKSDAPKTHDFGTWNYLRS